MDELKNTENNPEDEENQRQNAIKKYEEKAKERGLPIKNMSNATLEMVNFATEMLDDIPEKKEIEAENHKEEAEKPKESVEEKPVEEKKEVKEEKPINKKGEKGSMLPMFIIMVASLVIAFIWDKVPQIQNAIHSILDPTAGALLNWNLTLGMLVIVFMITLMTTLIQKYATDQDALRELKKEQKILQEEMKKYKDHPEKVTELSKKQMAFIPKTFKLTSRGIMFTGIPFILFFRWFHDVFTAMGSPKFFGFMGWFLFYFIFAMIFSSILRKLLKVV